jgi:hypothetical protein
MQKIQGTYTVKIEDKESGDLYAGSVVTIEIRTATVDAATTAAEAAGTALDKLGLTIPQVSN